MGREKARQWGAGCSPPPPPTAYGVWGHVPTWRFILSTPCSLLRHRGCGHGDLSQAQALQVLETGPVSPGRVRPTDRWKAGPSEPQVRRWGPGRGPGTAGPHGLRAQGYQSQGNTRVFRIFFQVFSMPACSRPSPSLLVLGCNQFGWRTADTLGRG